MPPKQPAPVQLPSFEQARRVFTGYRGGEGNLAAADTRPPLPRSRSKTGKDRVMLRALRVPYDDAQYTTNLITDDISIDLQPNVIREVASGMLEHLHDLTFPGNPARHNDDGPHN